MKGLETMLEKTEQISVSKGIEVYTIGTVALETPPLMIYDFPAIDTQLHIHGSDDGNILYGGGYKPYGSDRITTPLNGYELSMADLDLRNLGVKPLIRGRDY